MLIFLVFLLKSALGELCYMVNKDCVIQNRTITDVQTIWVGLSDGNIRIMNSVLAYVKINTSQINLSTKMNITITNSRLIGLDIRLKASNIVIYNSVISANGSKYGGRGSSKDPKQGHAYVGDGAFREFYLKQFLSYGNNCPTVFDDDPDSTFGSGGTDYNFTWGGGKIIISAMNGPGVGKVTLTQSEISASGTPTMFSFAICSKLSRTDFLRGGTGGTIFIEAKSIVTYGGKYANAIRADGGCFCGNSGIGGSAGRVVLKLEFHDSSFNIDSLFISTMGGSSVDPQITVDENWKGAHGTICLINNTNPTNMTKKLMIVGTNVSPLTPSIISYNDLKEIQNLTVSSKGLISFRRIEKKPREFPELRIMLDDSKMMDVSDRMSSINLVFKEIRLLSNSTLALVCDTVYFNTDLFVEQSSSLSLTKTRRLFLNFSTFSLNGSVNTDAKDYDKSCGIFLQGESLLMGGGSFIVSPGIILIYVRTSLTVNGNITSLIRTCPVDKYFNDEFFTLLDFENEDSPSLDIEKAFERWNEKKKNSLIYLTYTDFFDDLTQNNYTILIISTLDLTLKERVKTLSIRLYIITLT